MRISLALAAATLLMIHGPAHAQDTHSTSYKVEFAIHDGSGATAKIRRYTLVTTHNTRATFQVGSRVPVATGSGVANTQYTYLDIGVNIDCIVGDAKTGGLGMHGKIDMSSIVQHDDKGGNPPNPTVGQTKVEMDTAIELGKPVVVASIDDPETMRHLQVEAIVTRLN